MTASELEKLLSSLQGSGVTGSIDGLLQLLLPGNDNSSQVTRTASSSRQGVTGADLLVGPAPAVTGDVNPAEVQPKSNTTRETTGSSMAETVLKTAGMVTGVGPLVTGLLKLFGGSDSADASAAFSPIPFSLPEQISVQAGLLRDRSLTNVSYGNSGVARELPAPASQPSAPQINVNVQAIDTRSFLDHSDEIARAVRDAMLRSHSVNDVIGEL